MLTRSFKNPAAIFLIAGLMVITVTQILARMVLMTDFVKGALTGVGIGLEIIALIKLRSAQKRS